jgi:hypothetical protein
MRDGGMRRGDVRFDLGVPLSGPQIAVERERLAQLGCRPLGQAQPAPAVEGAMHQAQIVRARRTVEHRPGVGDRRRAAIEREQRAIGREEVRQRKLRVARRSIQPPRELLHRPENATGVRSTGA